MFGRLKTLSIKGLAWAMSESFGVAALSLGVFILLARILEPEHFGVVALAGVFIYSFNLILAHSFADAIVQRATLTPEHLDVAFWTTLAASLMLTAVCYAGAGYAAAWFHEPVLEDVLPWLAWVMPLNAIGVVQMALLRRELQFRTVAIRTLAGRIAGAAVGIGMALSGFGVWSLVGQQLAGTAAAGLAMVIISPWRPRLTFSIPRLRELWSFGFHVSASQTVHAVAEQSVNLLVGSLFGSTMLGYFNVAWRVVGLIRSLIGRAVYHVGFSTFSRLQDDRAAVARAALQATRLACLFGFPAGAGISLLAGPLVLVLFGEKWETSVPLLAILAIEMIPAFYTIFSAACYRALGRPGWALVLAVLYFVTGVAAIALLAPLGIQVVALTWVARAFLLLPAPVLMLQRILRVSLADVLAPTVVPAAATAVMSAAVGALVWGIGGSVGPVGMILAAVPVGTLTYAAAVALLSPDLTRIAVNTARIMVSPSRAPEAEA